MCVGVGVSDCCELLVAAGQVQKVMEIAPAPNLSKQTRENMYADAIKLVKAANKRKKLENQK